MSLYTSPRSLELENWGSVVTQLSSLVTLKPHLGIELTTQQTIKYPSSMHHPSMRKPNHTLTPPLKPLPMTQMMTPLVERSVNHCPQTILPIVRACPRPGTYHVLVLTELRRICGTGAQGDGSLLNALSRKCYMHMLQYVHRGTLP